MHAATVDLMMKKASFESDTAMAVAEAFDIAIQHAQLVTVPMLDARLALMDASFAKVDIRFAEVDARFVELEAKMDLRFAQFETSMAAQFAAAKSEQDARFLTVEDRIRKLEACFDLQDARFDKKLADLKAELVRWVFLAVLGNAALTASVNALMNSFQHFR